MTSPSPIVRPLTDNEIDLAREVFGNSIDYAAVRLHEGQYMPFQKPGTAMAPNGHLYMYGCYEHDYALQDVISQAHFIHEMTHVWQYQNRILEPVAAALELNLRHAFNYAAAYYYDLNGRKDLLEYNMEQQATIVQDYFLLTRSGCALETGHCRTGGAFDERLGTFEKVLAKFNADPAYARRDAFPRSMFNPKGPRT